MRFLRVLLPWLLAGGASAQVLVVGGGVGAAWERRALRAPGKEWHHSTQEVPFFFMAVPLDEMTHVRLEVVDLPRDLVLQGETWKARLRGYTLGVDYCLPGVFGEALVGAGIGSFRWDLAARRPPTGVEDTRFGFYLRVGEWFPLTRRLRLSGEVTYYRTNHRPRAELVTGQVGLAVRF